MAFSNGHKGPFAQSIYLNGLKIAKQVNDKCYEISRELFLSIVKLTPTDYTASPQEADYAKGVLINNWFPVDGPEFSADKTEAKDFTGSGSIARINSLKGNQFFRKDGTVTLSNNIGYGFRAEYAGWPLGQGPHKNWTGERKPYRMVAQSLILISAWYR